MGHFLQKSVSAAVLFVFVAIGHSALAQSIDPMASNNGLYPLADEYSGRFVVANLDYPAAPVDNGWVAGGGTGGPLTKDTAEAYAWAVLKQITPSFRTIMDDPANWDPSAAGWYDLVWSGQGEAGADGVTDPTSGREALMNSYTGQIMPADTFLPPYAPASELQNHAVIYYDQTAAAMLGRVFGNIYDPRPELVWFPEGAIVVKAEAVPMPDSEWPVLRNTATWKVFRPSITQQKYATGPLKAEVIEAHPFQMSIKIKDSVAAPETGWVFLGFVHDASSTGRTPWERFVPLGVMWGNDPALANDPAGGDVDPSDVSINSALQETWVNPDAPGFVINTLGWGMRLAGPMDVATRHNVLTPSGKRYTGGNHLRASSCLSCHGAAEFPFTANLYPAPNQHFPHDGDPFLLYDPGSTDWARWFQNRPGNIPMSGNIGGVALDYDMAIMFALSAFNRAIGNDTFVEEDFDVH
ncbi:hypothetical protein [Paracoccus aestuariivivens]|uniref:Cytochrome c domain-containing protein n=1 Tax=Paracoccus aestuariivivens TaxID=1820333 RepID=A0A6L6J477_9RHOB|nr:hypothetical protein [Paracoccus aestuariivivens]MTH76892.1 hypothetical protein [Paracoccus aestuariivivens]